MPFMKLSDGETKVVTLLTDPVQQDRHWVGSRSFDCSGTGCRYCLAGFPIRTTYQCEIEADGKRSVWTMPAAVYAALAASEKPLQGQQLKVTRRGTGLSTRYDVELMKSEASAASTVEKRADVAGAVALLKEAIAELEKLL